MDQYLRQPSIVDATVDDLSTGIGNCVDVQYKYRKGIGPSDSQTSSIPSVFTQVLSAKLFARYTTAKGGDVSSTRDEVSTMRLTRADKRRGGAYDGNNRAVLQQQLVSHSYLSRNLELPDTCAKLISLNPSLNLTEVQLTPPGFLRDSTTAK